MQYALLIYGDPATDLDPESPEGQAEFQQWFTYTQELEQSGALRAGDPLQPATTATTVRERGGERLVTDGPFAETREILGGFYVIDVPDLDAALEWARKAVRVIGLPIEVRPFQWA